MLRDLTYFLNKTEAVNDCLNWTGCLNTDGYPRAYWKGSVNGKLHRVIWELHNGKSPEGLVIRHTCDNPLCINPKHLISGTPTDNMKDRTDRDRSQGLKQKDVDLIKQLYYTKTYKVTELMSMFNVSRNTIYYTISHRK